MQKYLFRPGCKVNLYLNIVSKLDNGYHQLESLFYPLPKPFDELVIEVTTRKEFILKCSIPELENENILEKAYLAYGKKTGFWPGLNIYLRKKIPIGAGLGGGSSDAACMLKFLNSLAKDRALSEEDLLALGSEVGADVPFFILNSPAWVTGIGDKIRLENVLLTGWHALLVCPRIHISTAWAYRAWDVKQKKDYLLTREGGKDKKATFTRTLVLYNSFEQVVLPEFRLLYDLKLIMVRSGASAVVLSGSGSSMIAFFRRAELQEQASLILSQLSIPFYTYHF
ncbi:4-(cytidine 5'-diphospho)-2-C-methyl-D-erythritol kinase [Desulfohalobiaceae bacterium Ax17]|uniref:4-(cytidine 5'-diphospho)-2-C-methyl-D-erythritol kinase n=1 Tax=Desulfovulcanus ferrireducens TaxID=2831190 RepID=UPI00207B9F37|nr:4-(cytidine 5'-diphospho)-2-C-methyl-D-erythritol kinase [Desulfovulcanus ferrireducens]MBT8763956.1 4-(cytidine 5'-diphospho)-2-C-methyl-D-erythritol kinase [Desulfovulcanus ferrireducens]